jgi:hypothetical protein
MPNVFLIFLYSLYLQFCYGLTVHKDYNLQQLIRSKFHSLTNLHRVAFSMYVTGVPGFIWPLHWDLQYLLCFVAVSKCPLQSSNLFHSELFCLST